MSRAGYKSPVGDICVCSDGEAITGLFFGKCEINEPDSVCLEAIAQLREYFEGHRSSFELKLNPKGTEFQRRVWAALCEIPYGETESYSSIAERIGSPKAARAVGMANNKNPIGIIIPCHRCIGKNGSLVGYASGLETKGFLLELENKNKN